MEQTANISPGAATDEPASGSTTRRTQRRDGWTPERMRAFLCALAGGASISEAARSVGMSRQGAYAFRRRANGFAIAWRTAQQLARRRAHDAIMAEIGARHLRRPRGQVSPIRVVLSSDSDSYAECMGKADEWPA